MTTKPKLLIVDGMALLFRSFFRFGSDGAFYSPSRRHTNKRSTGVCTSCLNGTITYATNTYGSMLGYGRAYIPQ